MEAPGRFGTDPGFDAEPRLGASKRVYARLLRAYPRAFRARYEAEMVQLFGDQLRDARAADGVGGMTVTWIRTILDLLLSAVREHFREDRTMAQSLATFEPTRSMRWLGLVGIIGGLLLLWAWVGDPTDVPVYNVLRLIVFSLGGAAVSLALYPRLAAGRPRVAAVVVGAVVFTSIWQTLWILLSSNMLHPFGGTYGRIGFVASHLAWFSAAAFGAAVLWIPTAWAGMGPRLIAATRLAGLALAIGSIVTNVGDDRLGLVTSEPYGGVWSTIALTGLFLNGAGWVVLGAVLVLGGRASRRAAFSRDRSTGTVGGMTDAELLQVAIEQARIGRAEGGVPIGAAILIDGKIVGAGHNRRVQLGSAIRHGETDALEVAGRLPASAYRRATMATTLSPCDMCTGAILLYGIPRLVIGENRTFMGGEELLRSRGVEVVNLDSAECFDLLAGFIAEHPEIWNEDIGQE